MRMRLARTLGELRKAKGYTQRSLAPCIGYSADGRLQRGQRGRPDVARRFFERCDEALATSGHLAGEFDRIQARNFAEAREAAGLTGARNNPGSLEAGTIAGALQAFAQVGAGRPRSIRGAWKW